MLDEYPHQLLVAEHHTADQWSTDWTEERHDFYGVWGIPDVRFDGKYQVIGASDCELTAERYREVIVERLAETAGLSPIRIDGFQTRTGSTLSLSATFELLEPVTLLDPRGYLLVLEDGLQYQGETYDHITRAAHECAVDLSQPGDVAHVTAEFPLLGPGWDLESIDCIAFVQAQGGDLEIYQAARLPVADDFACAFEATVASAPEGYATIEFEGAVANIGEAADELTIGLIDTWGWPAVFKVEGDVDFHHEPVTRAVPPGGTLDLFVRVSTGGEHRVGAGCLTVASAGSGRRQPVPLQVYNCSPAILVVDADGAHDDEAIVLDALQSAGYLFRHWDRHYAHDGRSPIAAEMHGYDAVVWHTGWQYYDLQADVPALTEYIAAGGGFILSSQTVLGYIVPGEFTRDYLGLADWTIGAGADRAIGVPGDPVGDGVDAGLTYAHPYYNQANDLEPNEHGTIALNSEGTARIAVCADNGSTRAVVLAFALNAMDPAQPDPSNPRTLLSRAIEWLSGASGQGIASEAIGTTGESGDLRVDAAALQRVSPNPFAPAGGGSAQATIRLHVPSDAAVDPLRLGVYDASGRLVRRLLERRVAPGVWTESWDGCDAAGRPAETGVYHLQLESRLGRDRARLLLLR